MILPQLLALGAALASIFLVLFSNEGQPARRGENPISDWKMTMFDPAAVETAAHVLAAQRCGIWYTADLIAWLRSQQPPPPPRITQYYEGYTNAIEKLIATLEKTAPPT